MTLASVALSVVLLGQPYLAMQAQARVDSEVGMMQFGMAALFMSLPCALVVLGASSLWIFGLYRERALRASLFETAIAIGFAVPSASWLIFIGAVRMLADG